MWVTFERAEMLGANSVIFHFRPEQPLRYIAGQFVELQIPHQTIDERGVSRMFTLTSLPSEDTVSVAAAFTEPGSTFKRALQTLKPGARLYMGDPLGDFVLPKDPSVPMVWMAGGIGAASFVGMAKELTTAAERRTITLFQSARQHDQLVFSEHWQLANLTVQQTVTGPDDAWQGHKGRFTARDLLRAARHPDSTLFYLSGSEDMVGDVSDELVFQGLQPAQIVREAFTGY